MTYVFEIAGVLPGLNEYVEANRANVHAGNKLKQRTQQYICNELRAQKGHMLRLKEPVQISYIFFEPSRKRDKDNISGFAHKVIQDALVELHMLRNDGWANIESFDDTFMVDKDHPKIRIYIKEAE